MKKVRLIGILLLTTMMVITGCNDKEQDGSKVNTNTDVIKDQVVDVFSMENTLLIYENGRTTLETTVTNTSNETVYLQEFDIAVLDSDGNEMITLTGFVGSKMDAGESRVITSYCGEDLTSAHSIQYTVIK